MVWKAAWPASGSVTEIVPEAVRLPLDETPTSSVTVALVGSPIVAGVLAPVPPWMVKDTCFWVPSSAVTVNVSILRSAAPRDWVAELATE